MRKPNRKNNISLNFKAVSLLILLVTVFLLSALAGVQLIGVSSAEGPYDWPMFRHDSYHSGYSTSVAPSSNDLLWEYDLQDIVRASPAVADGKVYIGSINGPLFCLDAGTGAQLWSSTTGYIGESSPAVADGKVYIGSWDNGVYCLNAGTGAQLWNSIIGSIQSSSPTVADGKVYIGSTDYRVYCLDALTGTQLWSCNTEYPIYSSPAVANGKVYIGFGTSFAGGVYCLDAGTGAQLWTYPTLREVEASPAVANGKVYVGSRDGRFYCLDASTGTQIWNYYPTSGFKSSPAVANGKIYVGSRDDGIVRCFDAETGAQLWSYTTGLVIGSSPAVADGKVYIGSEDKRFYCLDALTGTQIWNYLTGDSVLSSPAVADGRVYVGSLDGKVYCFGVPSDDTPPYGSIIINGGAEYATSTDVTLTLTYSDVGSGVDKVRYTNALEWGSEPWEAPVTSKAWTLTSGEGIKYVSYQVRDKVGLISETYYDSIILDTTPPTGSIIINGGAASTSSTSVTLTLTYADATSGVDKVRYTNAFEWGSEPWETPVTSKAWTLMSGEGTKYVSYQVRDKAGHISHYWDEINLEADKVATPTFSPSGGTYPTSQSVTLSCDTSGATIRYTTDGSEPTASSNAYSSPILVNSGTVTVKAKAFKIGLTDSDTATATYTIIPPDEEAPTTQHDYDGLLHINKLTITLTATDDNEVAETYYRINDGQVLSVSANGQPEITTQGENNKIEFWSVDVTGNEELPHNVLTGIRLVIRDTPILIT